MAWRRALSSALTGPLPSAVEMTLWPFTKSFMVASVVVAPSARFSLMILNVSSSKSGRSSPAARPIRSAREASAAS
jgi:hypothetical protein